ncbi:hypothetical protein L916_07461, partial [Phytophthora nicotianae]
KPPRSLHVTSITIEADPKHLNAEATTRDLEVVHRDCAAS